MSVLVNDHGFATVDHPNDPGKMLDLGPETDPDTLTYPPEDIALVRVAFPSIADGRGFTIARSLRRMGYHGRLRACGQIMPDQYGMARCAGFDEVEIDDTRAARQPQADWLARANWQADSYHARLMRPPTN